MATQPPDPNIEQLLAELRSDDAARRAQAANQIRLLKIQNVGIRNALRVIAASDRNWEAKSAAHNALRSLRDPKRDRFWMGLIGCFVVNSLVAWLSLTLQFSATTAGGLLLVLNLAVLIVLALLPNWRWAVWGMLTAYAVALAVVLILGLLVSAICFSGSGNL